MPGIYRIGRAARNALVAIALVVSLGVGATSPARAQVIYTNPSAQNVTVGDVLGTILTVLPAILNRGGTYPYGPNAYPGGTYYAPNPYGAVYPYGYPSPYADPRAYSGNTYFYTNTSPYGTYDYSPYPPPYPYSNTYPYRYPYTFSR